MAGDAHDAAVGDALRREVRRARITVEEALWIERAAHELQLLDGVSPSWRSDAATWLLDIAHQWGTSEELVRPVDVRLTSADVRLIGHVALELGAEEDREAVAAGAVTWRTLAANDLTALADRLRVAHG